MNVHSKFLFTEEENISVWNMNLIINHNLILNPILKKSLFKKNNINCFLNYKHYCKKM